MLFWIALQVLIVLVETYVRIHVTSAHSRWRVRGYVVAIGAQFLWLAVMLHTHQYFLLPLLLLDGSIWYRGLVMNTTRKKCFGLNPEVSMPGYRYDPRRKTSKQ